MTELNPNFRSRVAFYVVRFIGPLRRCGYVCVPALWVRDTSDYIVVTAYPIENPSVTKDRVRNGEKHDPTWTLHTAVYLYGADTYEDAECWIVANCTESRNSSSRARPIPLPEPLPQLTVSESESMPIVSRSAETKSPTELNERIKLEKEVNYNRVNQLMNKNVTVQPDIASNSKLSDVHPVVKDEIIDSDKANLLDRQPKPLPQPTVGAQEPLSLPTVRAQEPLPPTTVRKPEPLLRVPRSAQTKSPTELNEKRIKLKAIANLIYNRANHDRFIKNVTIQPDMASNSKLSDVHPEVKDEVIDSDKAILPDRQPKPLPQPTVGAQEPLSLPTVRAQEPLPPTTVRKPEPLPRVSRSAQTKSPTELNEKRIKLKEIANLINNRANHDRFLNNVMIQPDMASNSKLSDVHPEVKDEVIDSDKVILPNRQPEPLSSPTVRAQEPLPPTTVRKPEPLPRVSISAQTKSPTELNENRIKPEKLANIIIYREKHDWLIKNVTVQPDMASNSKLSDVHPEVKDEVIESDRAILPDRQPEPLPKLTVRPGPRCGAAGGSGSGKRRAVRNRRIRVFERCHAWPRERQAKYGAAPYASRRSPLPLPPAALQRGPGVRESEPVHRLTEGEPEPLPPPTVRAKEPLPSPTVRELEPLPPPTVKAQEPLPAPIKRLRQSVPGVSRKRSAQTKYSTVLNEKRFRHDKAVNAIHLSMKKHQTEKSDSNVLDRKQSDVHLEVIDINETILPVSFIDLTLSPESVKQPEPIQEHQISVLPTAEIFRHKQETAPHESFNDVHTEVIVIDETILPVSLIDLTLSSDSDSSDSQPESIQDHEISVLPSAVISRYKQESVHESYNDEHPEDIYNDETIMPVSVIDLTLSSESVKQPESIQGHQISMLPSAVISRHKQEAVHESFNDEDPEDIDIIETIMAVSVIEQTLSSQFVEQPGSIQRHQISVLPSAVISRYKQESVHESFNDEHPEDIYIDETIMPVSVTDLTLSSQSVKQESVHESFNDEHPEDIYIDETIMPVSVTDLTLSSQSVKQPESIQGHQISMLPSAVISRHKQEAVHESFKDEDPEDIDIIETIMAVSVIEQTLSSQFVEQPGSIQRHQISVLPSAVISRYKQESVHESFNDEHPEDMYIDETIMPVSVTDLILSSQSVKQPESIQGHQISMLPSAVISRHKQEAVHESFNDEDPEDIDIIETYMPVSVIDQTLSSQFVEQPGSIQRHQISVLPSAMMFLHKQETAPHESFNDVHTEVIDIDETIMPVSDIDQTLSSQSVEQPESIHGHQISIFPSAVISRHKQEAVHESFNDEDPGDKDIDERIMPVIVSVRTLSSQSVEQRESIQEHQISVLPSAVVSRHNQEAVQESFKDKPLCMYIDMPNETHNPFHQTSAMRKQPRTVSHNQSKINQQEQQTFLVPMIETCDVPARFQEKIAIALINSRRQLDQPSELLHLPPYTSRHQLHYLKPNDHKQPLPSPSGDIDKINCITIDNNDQSPLHTQMRERALSPDLGISSDHYVSSDEVVYTRPVYNSGSDSASRQISENQPMHLIAAAEQILSKFGVLLDKINTILDQMQQMQSILQSADTSTHQQQVNPVEQFNATSSFASTVCFCNVIPELDTRLTETRLFEVTAKEHSCDAQYNDALNGTPKQERNSPNSLAVNETPMLPALPPEYDANDSRWTLKYREYLPGLVELLPGSSVYVSYRQLKYAQRRCKNCKSLARRLKKEVFSKNALRVCLSRDDNIASNNADSQNRPLLDQYAVTVLYIFVLKYGYECQWHVKGFLSRNSTTSFFRGCI